jgi:hypothetical protein
VRRLTAALRSWQCPACVLSRLLAPRSPPRPLQLLRNAGEESPSRTELGSKDPDTAAVPKLIGFIEQVDHIKPQCDGLLHVLSHKWSLVGLTPSAAPIPLRTQNESTATAESARGIGPPSMIRREPVPSMIEFLLSHLRSCERYDEPETLPSSICRFCLMSADGPCDGEVSNHYCDPRCRQ